MKHTHLTITTSLRKKLQKTGNDFASDLSLQCCSDLAAKRSLTAMTNSITGIDKYTVEPPEFDLILKLSYKITRSGTYNELNTVINSHNQDEKNCDCPSLPIFIADGDTKDALLITS